MNPQELGDTGSQFAQSLTDTERQMRDRFVEQYLEDYNAYLALCRCGYADQYAKQFSAMFMREPYTLNRIKQRQLEMGVKTDKEVHTTRVLAILYREANDMGSAGSARVSAATQISKMLGLDAPVKTQQVLPKVGDTDLSELSDDELVQLEQILTKTNAKPLLAQPH